ncbi:hypothetical protein JGH11_03525 [Dysgonomonas sp. Marseille-P4677]|uniref:hypothetical protein n=1 Tax=Dysgonomonas sp. Marseille-P4677 TaxID=2364790 RepID=UPI0019121D61|nr:hypothetical protein [Dysgonomonas sp. Marseille-P4677]MBK5719934.1 hypothetical protein [Dysgonomonas sp. Marseille-P4677]
MDAIGMNEAKQILREANIGSVVNCIGISITILSSKKDCNGCLFRTEDKANSCRFRESCFAHKRPDRESVIFKSK